MQKLGRTLMLAAGVMALAGSAVSAQSGIPVRKGEIPEPAATTSSTTDSVPVRTYTYTFSGGDVLDLAGWTDGNVMAHLIAGDSLEIELSNLAIARSQNAQIVEAARMLVSAHSAKLAKQREMVTSENIPPVAHPNDMSDEKMVSAINQLRSLSGAEFDRVWLRTQIEKHSMALKMIEGLEDVSRDDDLEDWVEESYTPIKDHLVHLNGLAPTFNVTPGVVTPKM